MTALHTAIIKNQKETVKNLLASGADVDVLHKGMTPLQIAILRKRVSIAKDLIDAGANKSVPLKLLRRVANSTLIKTLFPHLTLYGAKLSSILININAFKSLRSKKDLINAPSILKLLKNFQLCSDTTIEALKLLRKSHKVKKSELARYSNSEGAMDERKVVLANKYYTKVVAPHFAKKLLSFSTKRNKIHAVEKVLSEIRALVLDEILKQANENEQVNIIEFVNKNRKKLIDADEDVMKASVNILNLATEVSHGAWSALNPFVEVKGGFQNLFVKPRKNIKVWTLDVDNQKGRRPALQAHRIVTERLAVYYLASIDKTDGDMATRQTRVTNFIRLLSEIRNEKGINCPSCYPGTITRLADMGAFHAIAQLPLSMKEIIADSIKVKVIHLFNQKMANLVTPEEREALFYSLTELTEDSAIKIVNSPGKYLKEWIGYRKEFISSLGLAEVNLVEIADNNPNVPFENEDIVYIDNALSDCAKDAAGAALATIYERITDREPTIDEINNINLFSLESAPEAFEMCNVILKIVLENSPNILKSIHKLNNLSEYLHCRVPNLLAGKSPNEVLSDLDQSDNNEKILEAITIELKQLGWKEAIINPFDRDIAILDAQIQRQFTPAFRLSLERRRQTTVLKQTLFDDILPLVNEIFNDVEKDLERLCTFTKTLVTNMDPSDLSVNLDDFYSALEENDPQFIEKHYERFQCLLERMAGLGRRVGCPP